MRGMREAPGSKGRFSHLSRAFIHFEHWVKISTYCTGGKVVKQTQIGLLQVARGGCVDHPGVNWYGKWHYFHSFKRHNLAQILADVFTPTTHPIIQTLAMAELSHAHCSYIFL